MGSTGRRVGERPVGGRTLLGVGLVYVAGVVAVLLVLTEVLGLSGEIVLLFAAVVPLVPFFVDMAYAGRLGRVSADRSGFEVLFAQAVTSDVRPTPLADEIYEIPPSGREAVVAGYDAEDGVVEHRSVLWFQLGEWYDVGAVDEFVRNMPRLSYVVFTDPLGQFEGLMSAADFRSVYSTNPKSFLKRVERESVSSVEGVVTETVTPGSTNAEALEKMADGDVDTLGVVDGAREFVGVITQDAVSRGILLELFRRTES